MSRSRASGLVRTLWVWVLCGLAGSAFASEGPLSAYRHAGTAGLELSLGGFQGRVPDALLDSFYQEHGTLRGRGPSVDVGWYREGFLLQLSAHHLTVTTPDGVWLEKGKDKQDAVWAEQDLRLWGAELAFCYEFAVTRAIRLMTGIGYGAILRKGSLVMYPTEGTASASLDERTRKQGSQGSTQALPGIFMGEDLIGGVRYHLTDSWVISLDGGMRLYLYGGLSVSFRT